MSTFHVNDTPLINYTDCEPLLGIQFVVHFPRSLTVENISDIISDKSALGSIIVLYTTKKAVGVLHDENTRLPLIKGTSPLVMI